MKNFEPGDLITLKRVVTWEPALVTRPKMPPRSLWPVYGEPYTVERHVKYVPGRGWFITLRELQSRTLVIEVPELFFMRLVDNADFNDEINKIFRGTANRTI